MTVSTTPRRGRVVQALAAGILLTASALPAHAAPPPPSASQTSGPQPDVAFQAGAPRPDLAPLLEKIARGRPDEAAAATDELVRLLVEPVAAAIQGIEQRPRPEQRRLLEALGRVGAVLRVRLYRAELPAEDAQLFDEFAARDRDLIEKLFDDDPRRRLAALYQMPLEPGSAAGVLVTSKLFDWDAYVVEAALKIAARLEADPVTMRGLARFVEGAAQLVCSNAGLPAEEGAIWADFTRRAVALLAEARAQSGVPAIIEAVRCFSRPPYRVLFYPAEALEALGRIGDERAVPLLLECVEDHEQHVARGLGQGKLLRMTVGDAALLALVRIYGLPPDELGFVSTRAGEPATGFVDERSRRSALRNFLLWYKENGDKSPQERAPLTTQPSPAPDTTTQEQPAEQP